VRPGSRALSSSISRLGGQKRTRRGAWLALGRVGCRCRTTTEDGTVVAAGMSALGGRSGAPRGFRRPYSCGVAEAAIEIGLSVLRHIAIAHPAGRRFSRALIRDLSARHCMQRLRAAWPRVGPFHHISRRRRAASSSDGLACVSSAPFKDMCIATATGVSSRRKYAIGQCVQREGIGVGRVGAGYPVFIICYVVLSGR